MRVIELHNRNATSFERSGQAVEFHLGVKLLLFR
jgi:hypothetical protein